jgi:UDP-glucose 4-epimerase
MDFVRRASVIGRRSDGATVLVTGSSGALGGTVAAAAVAAGWAVRGCDRTPGPLTAVVGDLRELRVRRLALAGVQAVVHAAALHAPHMGKVPDGEFHSVNVAMTDALLAEAAASGVSRFIYTSSTSIYGHSLVAADRAVWADEELIARPRDIYDETKRAAETLVEASAIPAAILRVARCFPEPLPLLAQHRLHRGVAIPDVAVAHVLALEETHVTGIFNVAGPLHFERDDAVDLYQSAAEVIKRRAPAAAAAFAGLGWPLPDQLDRVYDSRAASNAFGYQPSEGVVRLLAAELERRIDKRP